MRLDPAPQTVVFDLDGTLVDTIDLIVATFQHVHREHLGIDLSREQVLPWIGRTLADIYADVAPGREKELTDAYITWNLAHLAELQKSYDGTLQLLQDLRADGRLVAIATSKRRGSALASLRVADMTAAVDVLVGMEDTRRHKPHPEPIQRVLECLQANAADAVYVGDAISDIQAARAAGVRSIAVTWGAGARQGLIDAQPTTLVDDVAGLRQALSTRSVD